MRNLLIILLAVLCAVLIIAGIALYPKYQGMQKTLEENQKAFAAKEAQLNQLKSSQESLIAKLKEQLQQQEVTIKEFRDGVSVTFLDRILFDLGKATLKPDGEKILQKVGETLKTIKGKEIRVVGHTDNIPIGPKIEIKFPTNWELSTARACTVVRYFQEKTGLDPKEMEAAGRSFYEPVAGNDTQAGRDQNRRVEIMIAPKLTPAPEKKEQEKEKEK